jgi:hypothetical protein
MILPAVCLSIPRSSLSEALTMLTKTAAQRRGEEAILTFDGTALLIELGGGAVTVPATGECSLQLRVPGIMLLNLSRVMPEDDPVPLVLEDRTHLVIASIRLTCQAQPVGSKVVDLPVNAEKDDILQALSDFTPLQIEQSGLTKVHARAVALQRITDAARLLMPLGITEQDLLDLVEQRATHADILLT